MKSSEDSPIALKVHSPAIKLVVLEPLPSLNKLFTMNQWDRHRLKKKIQASVQVAFDSK